MYYTPEALTFPLFDSFVVDFDYTKNSAVLWILQITSSRLHGGSKAGYREVRKIVAILKEQLSQRRPRKRGKFAAGQIPLMSTVEVRYLLVVPKGDSQDLQWQFPKGWNESVSRDDHCGNIYCLEIPHSIDIEFAE